VVNSVRHFIDLNEISTKQIRSILDLSHKIKRSKSRKKILKNKFLSMIFEKPSTRTRISFEIGMKQLGGDVITLDQADTQLGRGESIQDTIKVLGEYVDIILYRGSSDKLLSDISLLSSIPIINGLTDNSHPCQIMADILTLEEKFKSLNKLKICWVGDGNNVCNSWIDISKHFNFNLNISTPKVYRPDLLKIEKIKKYGKNINYFVDPKKAVEDADVVITDTWSSMGTKESKIRIAKFSKYQVNKSLMKLAKSHAVFLHCMPAHRGQEVTAEIIDGKNSLILKEASNRLHVQKSILLWCLNINY
tara:strand:+ start:617 stop:1531 length:915 start_codon:yes stop_codon:yes gene_type:complete